MSDMNEAAAPASAVGASQEDKTLALLTHLSGIVLSFIVPLVIWLINKDKADKPFLTDQAKEALNFQITIAGNLREVFAAIEAVGADVDRRSHLLVGSVLVGRMTVAGAA